MSEVEIEEQIAIAVATALKDRPRRHVNPIAVVSIGVALLIPMGGWTMSLANRVAVLEAQADNLRDAAVQLSALKQELTDFRNEFNEFRREQGHPSHSTIQSQER